jgi:hypothetical protein
VKSVGLPKISNSILPQRHDPRMVSLILVASDIVRISGPLIMGRRERVLLRRKWRGATVGIHSLGWHSVGYTHFLSPCGERV